MMTKEGDATAGALSRRGYGLTRALAFARLLCVFSQVLIHVDSCSHIRGRVGVELGSKNHVVRGFAKRRCFTGRREGISATRNAHGRDRRMEKKGDGGRERQLVMARRPDGGGGGTWTQRGFCCPLSPRDVRQASLVAAEVPCEGWKRRIYVVAILGCTA
jgi:hypothetical protein